MNSNPSVTFSPGDVMSLTDHFETEDSAKRWLDKNCKYIEESMVSAGWEAIEDLLVFDGIPLNSDDKEEES